MKKIINRRGGFTLIEMLAVMFLIGIIFSITAPAFGPIMSTMKLNTSSENLANVLESARQYAQTSGVDCYVVFPRNATIKTELNNRAYKLFSWDGKTSGKTIGKWEVLPVGLNIDSSSTFLTQSGTIVIPFPEDNSGGTLVVNCIQFIPSGRATVNASVKISDSKTFGCVTFYNYPGKIKILKLGKEPDA